MTPQAVKLRTMTLLMTPDEFAAYQAKSEDDRVLHAAEVIGICVSELRRRLEEADVDLRVRRTSGLFFSRLTPTAEA